MAHPLGLFLFCAFIVFAIVVAVWTFVPTFRKAMQGYSTVAEGGVVMVLGIFGEISGALQDAQAAGLIPPQLLTYVPFVIITWFILKRFMTSQPVPVVAKLVSKVQS